MKVACYFLLDLYASDPAEAFLQAGQMPSAGLSCFQAFQDFSS